MSLAMQVGGAIPVRAVDVDVAFVLYLAVDWLWLWTAGRLAGLRVAAWRLLAVAAAAAAAGVWALFPSGRWLMQPLPALIGSLALVVAAFLGPARIRGLVRVTASCFATGAAMAGGALLLGSGGTHVLVAMDGPGVWTVWSGSGAGAAPLQLLGIALAAAGGGLLWRGAVSWRQAHRGVVQLGVVVGGAKVQVQGLVDTGNCLVEPVSGLPVLIVEAAALAELPLGTAQALRPVPYRAVGGGGWLPAFRPDHLQVGGSPVEAMVALTASRLDPAGRFRALVPPLLMPGLPGPQQVGEG